MTLCIPRWISIHINKLSLGVYPGEVQQTSFLHNMELVRRLYQQFSAAGIGVELVKCPIRSLPSMKQTFVDPETGWTVVQEKSINPETGIEVFEENITNPETGEIFHRNRLASYQESIAEWVQKIVRMRETQTRFEQQTLKRLHQLYPELAAGAEVPRGALGKIKLLFAEEFAMSGICLPEEDVEGRQRGKIIKDGWEILYLFGSDELGEYLDYYASHRMTNDRHVRIYSDGQRKDLSSLRDFRQVSQDPQENIRLKEEFYAENRQVLTMLKEKGFWD